MGEQSSAEQRVVGLMEALESAVLANKTARTCRNCGHKRDVHGAYRAAVGWRCNAEGGGCLCPGFQPTDGSPASSGTRREATT